MIERSRLGTYIPVGMTRRSQMDATNPYLWLERAKAEGWNVCPDCAAEQAIRKREDAGAPSMSDTVAGAVAGIERAARRTDDRSQAVSRPKQSAMAMVPTDTNSQQGQPTNTTVRGLSEKLLKVSQAVAKLGVTPESEPTALAPLVKKKTLAFNVQPELEKPELPSIPDLMNYMDEVATEMHLDIQQTQPSQTTISVSQHRKSQSLLRSEDAESLLSVSGSPWPSNCAEVEKDYWALRKQAGPVVPTHEPSPRSSVIPPASVYTTAVSSRQPSMQVPTTENTLGYGAYELPISRLPSAILRAMDFSPAPDRIPSVGTPSSTSPVVFPPTLTSRHPASPSPFSSLAKPALRASPQPQRRVRVLDVWPPKEQPQDGKALKPLSPENVREQDQYAKQRMRMDRQKSVQDAAEIERQLRRRVRTKGGLVGGSVQKV
jgi:hypothetical protein